MERDTYNLLSLLDPQRNDCFHVYTFYKSSRHDPPSPVLSRFTLIFRVAKIGDQTDKGIELSGVECHEGEIFYAPNANFPWKRGDMHFFRLARFLLFTLIFRGKRGEGSSFKNVRSSIRNINSFLEISTRGNGKCYCLASLFSILSECFFFFFNNLKKTVSILGYKNSRFRERNND